MEKKKKFTVLIFIFVMLNAIAYADIQTDNLDFSSIKGQSEIYFYGDNNSNINESTEFNIFGKNTGDDGTGATRRMQINYWAGDYGNPDARGLGIHVHSNGSSQTKEVSFYSSLINNSWSGKAFQWNWGENSDGIFQLMYLNKISFPENYGGFYGNDTSLAIPGLQIKDEKFEINIDSNNNQASGHETFNISTSGVTRLFMDEDYLWFYGDLKAEGGDLWVQTTDATDPKLNILNNSGDTMASLTYDISESQFGIYQNSAWRMVIKDDGDVGFGISNPARSLQVAEDTTTIINIKATGGSPYASRIEFGDDADLDVGYIEYQHSSNKMTFRTNAVSDQMVLSSSGELTFKGVSNDGTGKVVCIKSDGNIGTCTDQMNATGYCTCT